jgi:hypothetical protein
MKGMGSLPPGLDARRQSRRARHLGALLELRRSDDRAGGGRVGGEFTIKPTLSDTNSAEWVKSRRTDCFFITSPMNRGDAGLPACPLVRPGGVTSSGSALRWELALPGAGSQSSGRSCTSENRAPAMTPGGFILAAGDCYGAIHDAMGERLVRSWSLPGGGRRIPGQRAAALDAFGRRPAPRA